MVLWLKLSELISKDLSNMQLSAVIIQSNWTIYYLQYCSNWGKTYIRVYISPSRISYEESIVRIRGENLSHDCNDTTLYHAQ